MSKQYKKFLTMGVVASLPLLSLVSLQMYNNYEQATHEMKSVRIYNNIWKNIDKKDMSQEIQDYRNLMENTPDIYEISSKGITKKPVELPEYLPNANNVEEKAIQLSQKTRLF